MRRVKRRDGSTEPLLLARLEQDLCTVLALCGTSDTLIAHELAGAVLHHLELNSGVDDILEQELDELLMRVLRATGHDDAADRFIEERARSEALLRRLQVHAAGGDMPWSRQRLAASLVRTTGLPDVMVGDLVAAVEAQLCKLGLERISAGLIAELAATGLLEFDERTQRSAATVAFSPRELGEICVLAGGEPQRCDRMLADAVLRRLSHHELHGGAVAAAVENHSIALPGSGDPFRPADLFVGLVGAEQTPAELARTLSVLLPVVGRRLVLGGMDAFFGKHGVAGFSVLTEALTQLRRGGALARWAFTLETTRAYHELAREHAIALGLDVSWQLPQGVCPAEAREVLDETTRRGQAVFLRPLAAGPTRCVLEIALNLPVLLEGVASPEHADSVMVRAAGLIQAAETQRDRLVDGNALNVLVHEVTGAVTPLREEILVSIWGLGAALERLIASGAGRTQDRPQLAARLLGQLDYAASDAVQRVRRFGFAPDWATRRTFVLASAPCTASDALVLPLGVPLFGEGNRELLATGLSERFSGAVPLPASILPPQDLPEFLHQLRTRTRLGAVQFCSQESGVHEVQGDLFRMPDAG